MEGMTQRNNTRQEHQVQESAEGQPVPVKVIKKEEPLRVTDKRFWVQPENEGESLATADYSFKPSYVEELEKKLNDSQKKLEEVLASYREFKAESTSEVQKARERIQNEYNRRLNQAKSEVVKKFIDVLENLDRASAASKDTQTQESLLQGLQLIRNQFLSALSELGVEELDLVGKPFNPELAEAIGIVEVDNEDQDQQIVEVVSKGYALQEILVRPGRVKVGKCQTTVSGTL
jgi:molecular chaperone GrpE